MQKYAYLLATALAVFAVGEFASAQPIDNFDTGANPAAGEYTAGATLLGQNPSIVGWSGPWNDGFGGANLQVVETGLSFNTLPVSGGAVQTSADANRAGRNLSNPVDGSTVRTQYFSFLMQAEGATNGSQITYGGLELHNANGLGDGDRQFQIVVGENLDGVSQTSNYSAVLFNSDDPQFAADLGPNDGLTNFFVAKFEFSDIDNMDSVSVYRNPSLAAEPANADFSSTGFNININSTTFARFGLAGTFTFDELRFGSTYESVTQAVAAFVPGDTNGDTLVTIEDFNPIHDNWLETNATFGSTLTRMDGDLDLSGSVNIVDFREWKNAFNGPPELVAAAFRSLGAVPEPSSTCLVLVASAWLGGRRRR